MLVREVLEVEPALRVRRRELGDLVEGLLRRFRPQAPPEERLVLLEIVEPPGDASGPALRPGLTPVQDRLLVADSHAGVPIDKR